MSMPPEVAQALTGGSGPSQNTDAPPMGPGATPPPGAAPMMTPQPPAGDIQKGKLSAIIALKMLEQSLQAFGSHTPEGAAVLKAMTPLTKIFGKDVATSADLMNSEKQQIAGTMPPGGMAPPPPGAPPAGAPPMGGAAPPGMPPPGMG